MYLVSVVDKVHLSIKIKFPLPVGGLNDTVEDV